MKTATLVRALRHASETIGWYEGAWDLKPGRLSELPGTKTKAERQADKFEAEILKRFDAEILKRVEQMERSLKETYDDWG
jgi:hypothetical protein